MVNSDGKIHFIKNFMVKQGTLTCLILLLATQKSDGKSLFFNKIYVFWHLNKRKTIKIHKTI